MIISAEQMKVVVARHQTPCDDNEADVRLQHMSLYNRVAMSFEAETESPASARLRTRRAATTTATLPRLSEPLACPA
jgi:hypothetical protein